MEIGYSNLQNKGFPTTHWSLVLGLGLGNSESNDALESLCRTYWPPIFGHLRAKGHSLHEAEDLTQEFFARLLEGNTFSRASAERGRFRTFLLASLRNFLINEWKYNNATKRGGGLIKMDFNAIDPMIRDAQELCAEEDPNKIFNRRWAHTLLQKVRERLRLEYVAAGQFERHNALKGYLLDGAVADSYADTAKLLGLSEAAVKSAIHKIRQRFGQMLREEIARTVSSEEDIENELRELISAVGR